MKGLCKYLVIRTQIKAKTVWFMAVSKEHSSGAKFWGKYLDTKQAKWQNSEENYAL
jgi:hypothetical protein